MTRKQEISTRRTSSAGVGGRLRSRLALAGIDVASLGLAPTDGLSRVHLHSSYSKHWYPASVRARLKTA